VRAMVLRYVCSNCGYVLYRIRVKPVTRRYGGSEPVTEYITFRVEICGKDATGKKRSYGPPTPEELRRLIGGRCPFCGKPLSLRPRKVVVKALPAGGDNARQA